MKKHVLYVARFRLYVGLGFAVDVLALLGMFCAALAAKPGYNCGRAGLCPAAGSVVLKGFISTAQMVTNQPGLFD